MIIENYESGRIMKIENNESDRIMQIALITMNDKGNNDKAENDEILEKRVETASLDRSSGVTGRESAHIILGRSRHRFSAFWLRSKCSICSYQLNI